MKKVIVYVEGPSDRLAMEELLADLLARLQTTGVVVKFIPTDGKKKLVLHTPTKAVNILHNDCLFAENFPKSRIVYPPNMGVRTVRDP